MILDTVSLREITGRAVGSAEQDQTARMCSLILLYTLRKQKKKTAWSGLMVNILTAIGTLKRKNSKYLYFLPIFGDIDYNQLFYMSFLYI